MYIYLTPKRCTRSVSRFFVDHGKKTWISTSCARRVHCLLNNNQIIASTSLRFLHFCLWRASISGLYWLCPMHDLHQSERQLRENTVIFSKMPHSGLTTGNRLFLEVSSNSKWRIQRTLVMLWQICHINRYYSKDINSVLNI